MNLKLFSGRANLFGGLSNEEELVKICPVEFENGRNKWSEYAMDLFFKGGNISNWKWKTDGEEVKNHQFNCFNSLLRGWGLKHEHKEAVAGWMLSEMLEEVPEYLPRKELSNGKI